jgi:REP element-mobilizing transposase RayT
MARGIERREIFRSDSDRWDYAARLSRLTPEWGGMCFAWAFMSNHVHLVLRTGPTPLKSLMHRLNTGYAVRFNRKYGRVGHLFQNRFRSEVVGDDADLLNVIRYVHLNPLRAGIVKDLGELAGHRWTGHGALIGARAPLAFEPVSRVLGMFDPDPGNAVTALTAWMAAPPDVPEGMDLDFERPQPVPKSLRTSISAAERAKPGDVDALVALACRHFSTSRQDLARGARSDRVARARAWIAFVAVVHWRLPQEVVASHVGVSQQAIAKAIARGAQIEEEEGPLLPREGS